MERGDEMINVGGIDFVIRDGDLGGWDERILRDVIEQDCYSLRELRHYHPWIGSIIDVGGNIGAFSAFARSLWPEAVIVCAEPFQPNLELLRENLKDKNVTIVDKAVVGKVEDGGTVGFQWPASHWRYPSTRNPGDGKVNRNSQEKVASCSVIELLEFLPEGQVDLMKLDCEGGEIEILESVKDDLVHFEFLRGEWHGDTAPEVLKAMLEPTHVFEFSRQYTNIGPFLASRRS